MTRTHLAFRSWRLGSVPKRPHPLATRRATLGDPASGSSRCSTGPSKGLLETSRCLRRDAGFPSVPLRTKGGRINKRPAMRGESIGNQPSPFGLSTNGGGGGKGDKHLKMSQPLVSKEGVILDTFPCDKESNVLESILCAQTRCLKRFEGMGSFPVVKWSRWFQSPNCQSKPIEGENNQGLQNSRSKQGTLSRCRAYSKEASRPCYACDSWQSPSASTGSKICLETHCKSGGSRWNRGVAPLENGTVSLDPRWSTTSWHCALRLKPCLKSGPLRNARCVWILLALPFAGTASRVTSAGSSVALRSVE